VRPGARTFRFRFRSFNSTVGKPCTKHLQCSWNPGVAGSWRVNRKQNAVQVFHYVNTMHDHLKARPIGFTRRAGNFEAIDDDAVQAQPDDGADTANGLPDSGHVDNANMGTLPDGFAPRMQMYLFSNPADPTDPFLPSNGGDEADVVYHEYTHGLSNRLVVDPSGVSTLGSVQAGSMGEAWSDWYAMDLLNNQGLQKDTKKAGEVRVGGYVGIRRNLIRTQPVDCPVGSHSAACKGTADAGPGGYTYGDFGKISGIGPEVHADGEIWGETLWDLRSRLGSRLTESLVTRAMELSPANPSFLDERNAILQASTVLGRGSARATIWKVFAHRGMGYYAGSIDGDDTTPVADRHLPPAPGTPRGTVTGTVVDVDTSAPAPGVSVTFGGHTTGLPNSLAAVTAADGRYAIRGIYVGTYPRVSAAAGGYDREIKTVTVRKGTTTVNWALRRDWASLQGGARIEESNDTTGTPFGCGPEALFDQSQGSAWSSERSVTGNAVDGRFVTVKLPAAIDVDEVAIDPSAGCGDAGSASTGPYRLETSPDGSSWTTASSGTFTPEDRGHVSSPALAAGSNAAVLYLRYTMLDSQVGPGDCPGPFSGCDYVDSTEIEVYGTPAG
jgi:extracellular elastinolytic metalloproteinase